MSVRSLRSLRGVIALAVAASFLISGRTMSTTGFSYVGNPDFRGYLAANNAPAGALNASTVGYNLGFVNNQGQITAPDSTLGQYFGGNTAQDTASSISNFKNAISGAYKTYQGYLNGANPAGTATIGGGMNQADYTNGIQQQYGSAIQGYTGEKANAMAANPVNLQDVQNVFDLQKNQAQNQASNQINTYNTQKSGIQSQQQLSLAQLADMIRGQHQGLQAQLGATGAGSSSAALMGDYALAHQQNQNAAAINTQAGGNVANVNAQIQQVQNTLDPYLQSLEGQKTQQLHNIMSNYNDLMARLESSIGQAQGEEKARLALFGQTLTQAASDSLAALNAGVAQQKQAYLDSINNAKSAAPGYQAPALQQAPAPVTAPNISPFQIGGGNNGAAEPIGAGGSLASILKQQQQSAIA